MEEPKNKKKCSKHANTGCIFCVCGEKKRLASKFCLVIGTQDVITCIKFGDDRLRGFWSAGCQSSPFPIDFDRRPYNSATLRSPRTNPPTTQHEELQVAPGNHRRRIPVPGLLKEQMSVERWRSTHLPNRKRNHRCHDCLLYTSDAADE